MEFDDEEMINEEPKVVHQKKDPFKLTPLTRKSVKSKPILTFNGIRSNKYQTIDKFNASTNTEGTLVFLDRNNFGRIINEFVSFSDKEWTASIPNVSKMHSVV